MRHCPTDEKRNKDSLVELPRRGSGDRPKQSPTCGHFSATAAAEAYPRSATQAAFAWVDSVTLRGDRWNLSPIRVGIIVGQYKFRCLGGGKTEQKVRFRSSRTITKVCAFFLPGKTIVVDAVAGA